MTHPRHARSSRRPVHRRRRGRRGRLLALGVLLGGFAVMPAASAAQEPDPEFSNLPIRVVRTPEGSLLPPGAPVPPTFRSPPVLQSSLSSTASFVESQRQWIEAADLRVMAEVNLFAGGNPNLRARCERILPAVRCDPTQHPAPGQLSWVPLEATAYPVDFEGEDGTSPPVPLEELRRFGAEFADFAPTRVRALAFGSIPVEATIHLSLPLDSAGLPVGLRINQDTYSIHARYCSTMNPGWEGCQAPGASTQFLGATSGRGLLEVRVSDVTLDGEPLAVGEECRLQEPAALTLAGQGFRGIGPSAPNAVPEGFYNARSGGTLQGTIEMGAFGGCGEGADDLTPLIDLVAGNTTMPARVRQGLTNADCFSDFPNRPVDPRLCNALAEAPFPEGDTLPALPDRPPWIAPAPETPPLRVG